MPGKHELQLSTHLARERDGELTDDSQSELFRRIKEELARAAEIDSSALQGAARGMSEAAEAEIIN